jgi:hypothetical protein
MKNRIKVDWFGSSFIGRSASGTAQTARKSVVLLSKNFSNQVHVILLLKTTSIDWTRNYLNKENI